MFLNSTQGLAASRGVGQYAATQHAMRAVADSLREEVNEQGVRVLSLFLGRTAGNLQRAIFAMEGRPYAPERLIQPGDVAEAVLADDPALRASLAEHFSLQCEFDADQAASTTGPWCPLPVASAA